MPARDPDQKRAADAKYYADHRDSIKARRAQYRADHREEARAWQVQYRAEHPEKHKASVAKHREANKEKVRVRKAKYYSAHRNEKRAYDRKYAAEHREAFQAWNAKHNAKKYGCPTDLISQWEHACRTGVCEICGKSATDNPHGRLHKDHSHTDPPTPRGCLCDLCNRGLGYFKDSPELLTKATQYLLARDPRYSK